MIDVEGDRPSRAAIEEVCMVLAVGGDECTILQLTERLGLDRSAARAVREAVASLSETFDAAGLQGGVVRPLPGTMDRARKLVASVKAAARRA